MNRNSSCYTATRFDVQMNEVLCMNESKAQRDVNEQSLQITLGQAAIEAHILSDYLAQTATYCTHN